MCAEYLGPKDLALLKLCSLDPDPEYKTLPSYSSSLPKSGSSFIDDWRTWERTLRLNLVRYRAQKLKWEAAIPPLDDTMDAAAVARAAVLIESPLEAEIFLDKARWDAIEALQGLVYFSSSTVFAYLLKLLLIERRALFKVEEGFAEYKGLYAEILANAQKNVESGAPK
jgi:hypothetical protein